MHVAGTDQRVSVAFIQGPAPVTPSTPVSLTFVDRANHASAPQMAEAHRDVAEGPKPETPGLPYFIVHHRFEAPGIYLVRTSYQGKTLEVPLQVTAPSSTPVPFPGGPMVSVATPTVANNLGVNPICTRRPSCPLHDVSLDTALAEHRPMAVLFATPALCQSRLCGPTLDNLLSVRNEFAGRVRFLHLEIYTDLSGKTMAPAVDAYHLESEPFLFLSRPDGTVFDRLDNAVDPAEMRDTLHRLRADELVDGRPAQAGFLSRNRVALRPDSQPRATFGREKDWPQPQVRWAFGLLIENPAPWRPSRYSRVAPVSSCALAASTTTGTPPNVWRMSSSATSVSKNIS